MLLKDQFDESASFIHQFTKLRPKTLIILGSGLGDLVHDLKESNVIPYSSIPHFPFIALEGHSGELWVGKIGEVSLYVMKGRNHYYQGFSDEEMRYPIQLFAYMGVKDMIITNACGGMNTTFIPGDIMLIEDHINMMGRNPLTGDNVDFLGPRFSDMTDPYTSEYLTKSLDISKKYNLNLKKGVYVGYHGPNYETKSEIKAYRMLGGDAVGMSTVPEVIVGAHSGMKILGISCITNLSTGLSKKALSHEEVLETSKTEIERIRHLITAFLTEKS